MSKVEKFNLNINGYLLLGSSFKISLKIRTDILREGRGRKWKMLTFFQISYSLVLQIYKTFNLDHLMKQIWNFQFGADVYSNKFN